MNGSDINNKNSTTVSNGHQQESSFSVASIGIENLFATAVQHNNFELLHQTASTLLDSHIVPTRSTFNLMTKTILNGEGLMPVTMHSIMLRTANATTHNDSFGWRPSSGKPDDWKFLVQALESVKLTTRLDEGPFLYLKMFVDVLDRLQKEKIKAEEHQLYLILDTSSESHSSTIPSLFKLLTLLIEEAKPPVRELCIRLLEHILLAFYRTKHHDNVYSRFYELFNSFKNNSYRLAILRTLKHPPLILETTSTILARNFDAGLLEEYISTRGSSTRPTKRARTDDSAADRSFGPATSLLHRFVLQDLLYRPFARVRTPKASPLMLSGLLFYLAMAILKEEPQKAELLKDDALVSQLFSNLMALKKALDNASAKDAQDAVVQIHNFITSIEEMFEYELRNRAKSKNKS